MTSLRCFTTTIVLIFIAGCLLANEDVNMLSRRSLTSLRCFTTTIVLIFIAGCLLAIRNISKEESRADDNFKKQHAFLNDEIKLNNPIARGNQSKHAVEDNVQLAQLSKVESNGSDLGLARFPPLNYNVHAFYYMWYGNPLFDGNYLHWNHNRLPHWDKKIAAKFSKKRHLPPDDIGAGYYPELGTYSSRSPAVMEDHLQQMRTAGIGVLVLSWYPPNKSDEAGFPSDDLVPILLDKCHKYDIKLAFHSEPYKNRTELTFLEDLKYITNTYGKHPALYRQNHKGNNLPMVYLYDSYLTPARSWARIFKKKTPLSIRGTKYDSIIIALYVEQKHSMDLLQGGFDGFYTYFASNKFTFGSRWMNWRLLKQTAAQNNLMFIPSIGPGYDDTSIRPWNSANTRGRSNGKYYMDAFVAAMNVTPSVISITSFNEWHEGTQIERAVPKLNGHSKYFDYEPYGPGYYLKLTQEMTGKFPH